MEEEEISGVVGRLEEYLTCMSIGRPELLKDFIIGQVVPRYV